MMIDPAAQTPDAQLREQIALVREKIAFYERKLLLLPGPDQEFFLKKEQEQLAIQLASLEAKLEDLGRQSLGDQIYRALLLLNYGAHITLFSRIAPAAPLAAFFVSGPSDHGQRWLINRLLSQRGWLGGRRRLFRYDLTMEVRSSGAASIWRQLASGFGLDRHSQPAQIAEKISACRQTQHVIFFVNCLIDAMPERSIADFVRDFWLPLVHAAQATPEATNRLLLFIVDYSGCTQPQPLDFIESYRPKKDAPPPDPCRIVRLPNLAAFSEQDLESWVGQPLTVEQLPDLPDRVTVEQLLDESQGGIPELTFEAICDAYQYDWLIGANQWLTLY